MVVFDPTGVLWCFCFTLFSFPVSLSRIRFTPSACHSWKKMIVKFFLFLSRNAIAQLQSAVVVLFTVPCLLSANLPGLFPARQKVRWSFLLYVPPERSNPMTCVSVAQATKRLGI